MTNKGTPKPVKELVRAIRRELIRRRLPTPVQARLKRIDKVDHWHVEARGVYVTLGNDFPGSWRINLSCTFATIPRSGAIQILESSAGLYAVGVPAFGRGGAERCLVRYDIDNKRPGVHLEALGPHLNVFQPGKLEDRIHYPIPGVDAAGWSFPSLLDVLLSERLIEDLRGRLA